MIDVNPMIYYTMRWYTRNYHRGFQLSWFRIIIYYCQRQSNNSISISFRKDCPVNKAKYKYISGASRVESEFTSKETMCIKLHASRRVEEASADNFAVDF